MERFVHDRIIIGMILSLGLAHLLKGVAKIIEHPNRVKTYWVHLLWVAYTFLLLVYFWWFEFHLSKVAEWNFGSYFFVIFYIVLYYIICSLLFPEDLKEYKDYQTYYYSRRKWIFGLLSLTFLADFVDTFIKGTAYAESLGIEYPIRNLAHFALCVVAMRVRKQWYHAGLAIVFILYAISWIMRRYLEQ